MLGYASTLEWTAEWYRRFHENGEQAHALVAEQIERYVKLSAT
jgi:hypothetical protein